MKVAVTGHTSGIGQGLYQYFEAQGHEVLGFSRSNGYALPDALDQVLIESSDCDVFVDNALPIQSQIDLLEKVCGKWKTTNKTIIVVSSIATEMPAVPESLAEYQQQKRDLDALCNRLRFSDATCKILSIHPGYVATNIFDKFGIDTPPAEHCMSVDQVISVVDYMLNSPVYIHDITFNKR